MFSHALALCAARCACKKTHLRAMWALPATLHLYSETPADTLTAYVCVHLSVAADNARRRMPLRVMWALLATLLLSTTLGWMLVWLPQRQTMVVLAKSGMEGDTAKSVQRLILEIHQFSWEAVAYRCVYHCLARCSVGGEVHVTQYDTCSGGLSPSLGASQHTRASSGSFRCVPQSLRSGLRVLPSLHCSPAAVSAACAISARKWLHAYAG